MIFIAVAKTSFTSRLQPSFRHRTRSRVYPESQQLCFTRMTCFAGGSRPMLRRRLACRLLIQITDMWAVTGRLLAAYKKGRIAWENLHCFIICAIFYIAGGTADKLTSCPHHPYVCYGYCWVTGLQTCRASITDIPSRCLRYIGPVCAAGSWGAALSPKQP